MLKNSNNGYAKATAQNNKNSANYHRSIRKQAQNELTRRIIRSTGRVAPPRYVPKSTLKVPSIQNRKNNTYAPVPPSAASAFTMRSASPIRPRSVSPLPSARSSTSTTSTTSLFSAPERNAQLRSSSTTSSPLPSARSTTSNSSTSSIFFAPGGKRRTRRHKKHAKRTRKH